MRTNETDARLAAFALAVLSEWNNAGYRCDIDGGTLQDLAVRTGVVIQEQRRVPCGDVCPCAEMLSRGEETTCYPIAPDVWARMRDTSEAQDGAA